MTYVLSIPTNENETKQLALNTGATLIVLGKNGSGKSSLLLEMCKSNYSKVHRISSQRVIFLQNPTAEIMDSHIPSIINNRASANYNISSRYKDDNQYSVTQLIIAKFIFEYEAHIINQGEAKRRQNFELESMYLEKPTPLDLINRILCECNLNFSIAIEREQSKSICIRKNGEKYSLQQASDGERNIFLICADVICSQSGSLIMIDEPEQHLHQSIVPKLIRLLNNIKNDCAFIIATHNIEILDYLTESPILFVNSCKFIGNVPKYWDVNIFDTNTKIPDEFKSDILGARKQIIFVEGKSKSSLDRRIYEILFPQVSIVPKGSCSNVKKAVSSFKEEPSLHWLNVSGLIDRDFRTNEEVKNLRSENIFCLPYNSIESLIYHPTVLKELAEYQSKLYSFNAVDRLNEINKKVFSIFTEMKNENVMARMKHVFRRRCSEILNHEINLRSLENFDHEIKIQVDIKGEQDKYVNEYEEAIGEWDYLFFLKNISFKRGNIRSMICEGLEIKSNNHYEDAALSLISQSNTLKLKLTLEFDDILKSLNAFSIN